MEYGLVVLIVLIIGCIIGAMLTLLMTISASGDYAVEDIIIITPRFSDDDYRVGYTHYEIGIGKEAIENPASLLSFKSTYDHFYAKYGETEFFVRVYWVENDKCVLDRYAVDYNNNGVVYIGRERKIEL